jgi:hypothetical protein
MDVHLDANEREVEFRVWKAGADPDTAYTLRGIDTTYRSGIVGVALQNAPSEGATFRYMWISHERITGEPPRAGFTETRGEARLEVQFDASTSTPPAGECSYRWDFGDGTGEIVTDDPVVTHTYDDPGVYDVRLWFTDDRGLTSATVRPVEVPLPGPVESFRRGDANADGGMNMADAVYILQNLFAGGRAILCPDAADANDDEGVNLADAIYILQNLFGAGPAIAPPYPDCGVDTTSNPDSGGDDLEPCSYDSGLCNDQ